MPDEQKLMCRIKHALIALYQAEEHLPPGEPLDSKLRLEFRTQIERLRAKLLQIAGPESLEQFDTQRGSSPDDSVGAEVGVVRMLALGTPATETDRHAGGAGLSSGTYPSLPGRMSNEQLAHELLLDPTFQLDESGGCSAENPVFHRIRKSFHQAFWDSLVDDLCLDTPCYTRVLRVLAEIRDGIHDLAGTRDSCNIMEAVDIDFIRTQAEQGLFDWRDCLRLITAVFGIIQQVLRSWCLRAT